METTETYTCPSCGHKSEWPISVAEIADCRRMRHERRMRRLRLAVIIAACILLPILVRALLARL
jgi:hypothetical protein